MFATYIGHHRGGRGTEIERRGRVVGSGDDFYLADRQRDDTDSSWSCMIHLGVSPCVCVNVGELPDAATGSLGPDWLRVKLPEKCP